MAIVIPHVEQEKDIFEVKIRFRDLTIRKNEIVSALGYADGVIPGHFEEMIEDILSRLPKYCEIQAGYRLLDVAKQEGRNDGLCVGGKFFKLQKIVARQLRKSEKAALFVSTIGPAMETWAKKLSAEGDAALGYLVDTVASVTEEQTTDVLHDNFCGITLTESALMVPMKSVSGIIGVGKTVQRVDYTCDLCGMKDCTYRAIRNAQIKRGKHKS